jgi:hypothetical protein
MRYWISEIATRIIFMRDTGTKEHIILSAIFSWNIRKKKEYLCYWERERETTFYIICSRKILTHWGNLLFQTIKQRVRFEVFTAVTMKNGVFWDDALCGSCKNQRFGGIYHPLHQGVKNRLTRNNTSCNLVFLRSLRRLLVTASVVPIHRFLSPWWGRR